MKKTQSKKLTKKVWGAGIGPSKHWGPVELTFDGKTWATELISGCIRYYTKSLGINNNGNGYYSFVSHNKKEVDAFYQGLLAAKKNANWVLNKFVLGAITVKEEV